MLWNFGQDGVLLWCGAIFYEYFCDFNFSNSYGRMQWCLNWPSHELALSSMIQKRLQFWCFWNFYLGLGDGSALHLESGTIFNEDFHNFQFAQLFGIRKCKLFLHFTWWCSWFICPYEAFTMKFWRKMGIFSQVGAIFVERFFNFNMFSGMMEWSLKEK